MLYKYYYTAIILIIYTDFGKHITYNTNPALLFVSSLRSHLKHAVATFLQNYVRVYSQKKKIKQPFQKV